MRDQLAPAGRFFPTARGTPMGADNGSVHTPELFVDHAHVDMRGLQSLKNLVEQADRIPGIEQPVDRFPGPKFLFRQISPWRAGSENPQNRIDYHSTIRGRTTGLCWRRKHIRDYFPLIVRDCMSRHCLALLGVMEVSDSQQSVPFANSRQEQFQNRT
jgi:hypothetical protein